MIQSIPTRKEPVPTWCKRHFDSCPGTYGPINYGVRNGEIDTLKYLWENREDIEKIAAILISATLFPYCSSSRGYRPQDMRVRTNVEKVCSDNMEELMNKATELKGPAGWGCCKVCSD